MCKSTNNFSIGRKNNQINNIIGHFARLNADLFVSFKELDRILNHQKDCIAIAV